MRIRDWSSDGCSSDLGRYVISVDRQLGRLYYEQWQRAGRQLDRLGQVTGDDPGQQARIERLRTAYAERGAALSDTALSTFYNKNSQALARFYKARASDSLNTRSEEPTSELQSLMRISYAVFCLKKKKKITR